MCFNHFSLPSPLSFPNPNSQGFTTHGPPFMYVSFSTLDLDYTKERKHAVFVSLSLAYFAEYDNLQFHSFFCKKQKCILLYGGMVLYCLYIYHIFIIHSSTDRHLCWFNKLTTRNSTVIKVNTWVSL
jgi:hypothetical protein